MTADADSVLALIAELPEDDRRRVFDRLREGFSLHPLESDLNTTAEVVLEAITERAASFSA